MMATIRSKNKGDLEDPDRAGPVGSQRIQHPVRVVGGVAALVVAVLAFAVILQGVDHRHPVLVFTKSLQPGERITNADVGQASIAASGISTLRPSQRSKLVGKVATGRLPAGSVASAGEVAPAASISRNLVELPINVKQGAYPPDLAAGQPVLIVVTPGQDGATSVAAPAVTSPSSPTSGSTGSTSADSSSSSSSSTGAASGPVVAGQVVSVSKQSSPGSEGAVTVEVAVPSKDLASLASASAAGLIVLATESS